MKKTFKQFLVNNYIKARNVLETSKRKNEVVEFKKEIWQSEEVSRSFVKGTDANTVIAAEMMDREVNEFFLSSCNKGDKVLDIGCGHGVVSIFLAENGMNVTSVDISEKLLDELRSRIANKNLAIDVKQGDAYNIPSAVCYFDVVVARMFLPHFPDWPKVLGEMARVTKPGGKLLVHFSSKENTDLGKRLALKDCQFGSSPDISNPWLFYAEADQAEIKKVSVAIGLEMIRRTPVSFFLHNRIIGYQLGTERYNVYMDKVQDYFKDPKVMEFALWFDKEIISEASPELSHFNIITFKKL